MGACAEAGVLVWVALCFAVQPVTTDQVLTSAGETGSAASQVLNAAAELASQSLQVKRQVDDFLRDIQAATLA